MCDPDDSAVAILPVPYDATSTWRKGADKGPLAIVEASSQVEWYDVETGLEVCRRGITTLHPVLFEGPPDALARIVRSRVSDLLAARKLPVLLGGEHSVSIGAIQACAERYSDLTTLQIDAHGDTREVYHDSPYNHACVMARAREVSKILQVGIRAVEASEMEKIDRARCVFAHEVARSRDDSWIDRIVDHLTPHTYLTIDLDGFDPSLIPATGTPEPGGLTWYQVLTLIERVAHRTTIVGFDVVELCPQAGEHASAFVAAKLVNRVLSVLDASGRFD
ncbi:MAG: agmatinase [Phycisphaeraceae bacterium]|nr:agmatinase [Phycisphaeraceae bacterium]